jgi:hypothetical protein
VLMEFSRRSGLYGAQFQHLELSSFRSGVTRPNWRKGLATVPLFHFTDTFVTDFAGWCGRGRRYCTVYLWKSCLWCVMNQPPSRGTNHLAPMA